MNTNIKQLEQLGFSLNPTKDVNEIRTTYFLTKDEFTIEVIKGYNVDYYVYLLINKGKPVYQNIQFNEFIEDLNNHIS